MKKILFLMLFSIIAMSGHSQQIEYRENELLVKFDPTQPAEAILSDQMFIDLNVNVKAYYPRMGVWHLTFQVPERSDMEVLSMIRADARTVAAQFNHRVTLRSSIPDDQYFNLQWNLNNTGQTGGTEGADISALDAWHLTTGGNGQTVFGDNIVLAVIDGGFDLNHEDMNFTSTVYDVHRNSENPADMTLDDHGTWVAGIAGAIGNNSDGISGVSWTTQILPVGGIFEAPNLEIFENYVVASYEFILDQRVQYNDTNGLDGEFIVAANSSFGIGQSGGADPDDHEIWCSMYDSLGVHGIVSMAATANDNVDIDQVNDVPTACPSNYLISVTNTDHNDNRNVNPGAAWGATTVDLGAPGTDIVTTAPNNEYTTGVFGAPPPVTGTSYATPHVTGAVGLIYSILSPDKLALYSFDPSQAALDLKAIILNSVEPVSSLENITVTGGRLNVYQALIYTIENHGAILGIDKPLVTLPLYENIDFHEDVYLASGATMSIEARDSPVTLTSNSGSVTIGKLAAGSTQAKPLAGGGDRSGDEDEIFAETPESITHSANYPNPFNPVTVIRYELPVNSNVRLEVFDIIGRRVAVLADGMMEAGTHEVTFDASRLSSGVYLYRLTTNQVVQTRQMVLVK